MDQEKTDINEPMSEAEDQGQNPVVIDAQPLGDDSEETDQLRGDEDEPSKERVAKTDNKARDNYGNMVGIFNQSIHTATQDISLSQISNRYREIHSGSSNLDGKLIDQYATELAEERLLFISSKNSDSILEAVHHLVKKLNEGLEGYQTLEIRLTSSRLGGCSVELPSFSGNELLSGHRKLVLVANVAIEYGPWKTFYDSLFSINNPLYRSIKADFADHKVYLILFNVSGLDPKSIGHFEIPVWKIATQLADHKNKLGELTEKMRSESVVHMAARFVATFFNGLNYRHFDDLTSRITSNMPLTVQLPVEGKDKDGEPFQPQEISAKSYWANYSDQILQECGIGQVWIESQGYQIRFLLEGEAQLSEEIFWSKYPGFIHQQFEFLSNRFDAELGLMFSTDVPQYVSHKMTSLNVEMALADQQYHDHRWLDQLVEKFEEKLISEAIHKGLKLGTELGQTEELSIQRFVDEKIARYKLDGADPYVRMSLLYRYLTSSEAFKKVTNELEQQASLFFNRLSDLLWEMMQKPELQRIVEEYCENSLSKLDADNALLIIDRLAFSPHFNEYKWLQKLLEYNLTVVQDKDELRTISEYLHRKFSRKPMLLTTTTEFWLKPLLQGKKAKYEYERSFLGMIWEHYVLQVINISTKKYGVWPSPFFLFKEDESGILWLEYHKKTIKLLARPGLTTRFLLVSNRRMLAYAMLRQGKKYSRVKIDMEDPYPHYQLFADLVESFYLILTGCGKNAGDVPKEITNELLAFIDEIIPNEWRPLLIRHWKHRVGLCNDFFSQLGGIYNPKSRNHHVWSTRHFAIERLIYDFQHVQQQSRNRNT